MVSQKIHVAEVIGNMSHDRFLLIKAWSYILWADVEHVMSQLLIAELTDRIPVVYWPTHCLHNGFVNTNGFEIYFEPVSSYTIFDIAKPEYTFYPPIWDSENLLVEDQGKDTRIYRNLGDILGSTANVVIGDVYIDLYNVIPFIKKSSPAYGMSVDQIYHYLFHKYLRVKEDIWEEVSGFYHSWLKDESPILAVHVCRVDKDHVFDPYKSQEYSNMKYHDERYGKGLKDMKEKPAEGYRPRKGHRLLKPNKIYHEEIKKFVDKYNVKKIFLLTDSDEILKEYRKKYGPRIVNTQCKRIGKGEGPSYMENPMVKRRRGIEIIKDTYLASQCDFFIGNDFSSLSHSVTYLKDFPSGNVKLLYWKIKKRKYPVNVALIARREKRRLWQRVAAYFQKLIKKH